jgi:hypothetical protein
MHCFLFKFTLVLNSVLLFWKLLVFELLLGTSETALLNVCSISKNYPSARCASAANADCRDGDLFGAKNVPHNILQWSLRHIITLIVRNIYIPGVYTQGVLGLWCTPTESQCHRYYIFKFILVKDSSNWLLASRDS